MFLNRLVGFHRHLDLLPCITVIHRSLNSFKSRKIPRAPQRIYFENASPPPEIMALCDSVSLGAVADVCRCRQHHGRSFLQIELRINGAKKAEGKYNLHEYLRLRLKFILYRLVARTGIQLSHRIFPGSFGIEVQRLKVSAFLFRNAICSSLK